MKQKNHNKIFKIIQSGILVMFLLAGVFGFSATGLAAETGTVNGCTMAIKTMEIQPQNVTSQSLISLMADVTQIGTGPACQTYNQVNFIWYALLKCSTVSGGFAGSQQACPSAEIAKGLYDFTTKTEQNISKSSDFSNVDFSQLANPNVLPYYMVVQSGGTIFADTKAWKKELNISGQNSSGGANLLKLNISFDKSVISPSGGDLVVTVNADNSVIQQLPSKVAMLTYVCDSSGSACNLVGNNYGTNQQGIDKNALTNNRTFQNITPSATVFKNDSNYIKVVIQDAVSPFRPYAQSTGIIQGKGFAAAVPPPEAPTPAPAPGTPVAPGVGPTPVVPSGNCNGPTPNPDYCLYNPLPVNSLGDTLLLIMRAFLGMIAVWAVAFIVIGGFRLVVSSGNEEQVTAAKKTITWAIVGLVIAMLSFSIIAILQNILGTSVQDVKTKTSSVLINRKIGMADGSEIGKSDRKEDGL